MPVDSGAAVPAARERVTRERLLEAAVRVLDERGADSLTLTAVANALGIRTPSLYHHVDGVVGLRLELRLHGVEQLGEALQRAAVGRSGRDALRHLAAAYRDFALHRPGLYALTLAGAPDDERVRAAAERVLQTLASVLRGYGLEREEALHATRLLRSALHGFVDLERAGGFALGLDVDESFERRVGARDAGLRSLVAGSAASEA